MKTTTPATNKIIVPTQKSFWLSLSDLFESKKDRNTSKKTNTSKADNPAFTLFGRFISFVSYHPPLSKPPTVVGADLTGGNR